MRVSLHCASRYLLGSTAFMASVAFGQPTSASGALHVRSLAATCASCHGTDGHAVPGLAMPPLAGRPKAAIVAQLNAFRDGSRPATVMHQIVKGYTPEQLDAIAAYFANVK